MTDPHRAETAGRRRFLRLAAGLAMAPAMSRADAPPGVAQGLLLAALAEQVGKLHVQAAQGVLAGRARAALPELVRELDAGIAAARRRAAPPEARDNVLLLALLWEECRAWALRPPTRDNALGVSDRVEEVAWVAAKEARNAGAAVRDAPVPLALTGAMLGPRSARLELLRRWAPRSEELAARARAALAELAAVIARLGALPASAAQASEVEVARTQLAFLERIVRDFAGAAPGGAHAEAIAKIGDHLLEAMRRAARAYAGRAE